MWDADRKNKCDVWYIYSFLFVIDSVGYYFVSMNYIYDNMRKMLLKAASVLK